MYFQGLHDKSSVPLSLQSIAHDIGLFLLETLQIQRDENQAELSFLGMSVTFGTLVHDNPSLCSSCLSVGIWLGDWENEFARSVIFSVTFGLICIFSDLLIAFLLLCGCLLVCRLIMIQFETNKDVKLVRKSRGFEAVLQRYLICYLNKVTQKINQYLPVPATAAVLSLT